MSKAKLKREGQLPTVLKVAKEAVYWADRMSYGNYVSGVESSEDEDSDLGSLDSEDMLADEPSYHADGSSDISNGGLKDDSSVGTL